MKAFTKTFRLALIALMFSVTSLHAQWDTLYHSTPTNIVHKINDLFFISNTGYAVGWWGNQTMFSQGLIYKTTDGGLTWSTNQLPATVAGEDVQNLTSVYFTSPNVGYVTAECYTSSIYHIAVLKTTDGGITWTSVLTTSNNNTEVMDIQFTSTYSGYVLCSDNSGATFIYQTNNGGTSWNSYPVITSNAVRAKALHFDNNGNGSIAMGDFVPYNGWFYGPYNGIGKIEHSTDYGNTWTNSYTDNEFAIAGLSFPTAQTGYAIGDSTVTANIQGKGKVLKTTDGGQTWNSIAMLPNFDPRCVFFTDNNTGYIGGWVLTGGGSGILKTTDGGITWTQQTHPNYASSVSSGTPERVNVIDFSTPATGYAVADSIYNPNDMYLMSSTAIYSDFQQACAVYAGQDTTFCQQTGQIFATPGTPGPNYVFAWSPSTGLSDSTAQAPFVNHVSNQQYVVTMTDTVTNCVATDTIVVSAYEMITGPLYYCPVDSVLLDFGPGASAYFWQYFTDTNNVTSNINQNTQTYWATEPGYYLGFASFAGCGAITSYVHVIDSCSASFSCSVNAGPDTTFCQQQGQLFATPASPGNYTFSWSPANGLSNPNVQNPYVISGVNNQQYVVTMTDAAQNCTATDTVIVSAYYYSIDTVYSCNNQPITLDLGPGANNYTVQFTDTSGNPHFLTLPNQYLIVTQPATYLCIAFFPSCGALTSLLTVIDSCSIQVGNVWPGDCNYDLVANNADALNIGLAYNATGATRPNASPLWYAQPMTDWSQNFVNCNYKHADADGNGIVDVNDTLPIYMNYGNTHPFRLQPVVAPASSPALTLVANYDTVGLQTLVTVDIRLGTAAIPIDSLYGISFRITADAGLIDTTLTIIDLNQTWLGTMNNNMFGFRKYFRSVGSVDAAESRNNLNNRLGGNGTIGTFYIVTTDNLSGIAVCHINVTDITAVTVGQTYLTLNTVNDSVVIDPMRPAGIATAPPAPTFTAYPNPANSTVTVQTNGIATQVEICDMLGRTIMTVNPTSNSTAINTSELAEGVYLLRVKNGKEVSTQKLSITH